MNYKHLHYFWTVARLGSVVAGAEQLGLASQTISAQIKLLELQLGTQLFVPAGRGIALTDAGRLVMRYADEIFALGDQLEASLNRQQAVHVQPFRVGVSDAVPKSIAHELLTPALEMDDAVRLLCREGRLDVLLAELALNRLEAVIADRPLPAGLAVRGYSHALGDSALAFFATPAMAAMCEDFPACLSQVPLLLPSAEAMIRMRIDAWLTGEGLVPRIAGEFEDSALMKAFGRAGSGVFPAPEAIASAVCDQYGVIKVGRVPQLRENFYVITGERRISHPATLAITRAAHGNLFAREAGGVSR